jgi:hypothetical protein
MVKESALKHKVPDSSSENVTSLSKPRLRWKNQMSKDVERVEPDADWRTLTNDRERLHGMGY